MAKIVIDIDDKTYKAFMELISINLGRSNYKGIIEKCLNAIKHGKVLPKGHGRLIDADKFLKDNEAYTGWILNSSEWGGENAYKDTLEDLVNEAPAIIEADKEG